MIKLYDKVMMIKKIKNYIYLYFMIYIYYEVNIIIKTTYTCFMKR